MASTEGPLKTPKYYFIQWNAKKKNTFKVRFSSKQTYLVNNCLKLCRSRSLFDIGGLLFACCLTLEVWSAGFSSILTSLHCCGSVREWIICTLFATNLLALTETTAAVNSNLGVVVTLDFAITNTQCTAPSLLESHVIFPLKHSWS